MGSRIVARACVLTLILATTLAAVSGATAARSSHLTASFVTPEKAAYCRLAVKLETGAVLHLLCWTPRNGLTVALPKTGRARRLTGSTQATRGYTHARADYCRSVAAGGETRGRSKAPGAGPRPPCSAASAAGSR